MSQPSQSDDLARCLAEQRECRDYILSGGPDQSGAWHGLEDNIHEEILILAGVERGDMGGVKPRALDLFCGAGGATKGLQRAGFHVTGVDIKPQPRYCGDAFHQADALTFPLEGFDYIWAGPVCKRYSLMSIVREGLAETHPDQIPELRRRLLASGLPYTIENVQGAPLLAGSNFLCGQMFDLGVIRHRWFESSFGWLRPHHPKPHAPGHLCIVGHGGPANRRRWKIAQAREAMGIDWMSRDEIVESIPPAYSDFIGRQFLATWEPATSPHA